MYLATTIQPITKHAGGGLSIPAGSAGSARSTNMSCHMSKIRLACQEWVCKKGLCPDLGLLGFSPNRMPGSGGSRPVFRNAPGLRVPEYPLPKITWAGQFPEGRPGSACVSTGARRNYGGWRLEDILGFRISYPVLNSTPTRSGDHVTPTVRVELDRGEPGVRLGRKSMRVRDSMLDNTQPLHPGGNARDPLEPWSSSLTGRPAASAGLTDVASQAKPILDRSDRSRSRSATSTRSRGLYLRRESVTNSVISQDSTNGFTPVTSFGAMEVSVWLAHGARAAGPRVTGFPCA